MRRTLGKLLVALSLAVAGPSIAETYYVAPPGTVIVGTPDGSGEKPFASLTTAFASGRVKGGDTILLKDGAYGDVDIRRQRFATPVEISSETGRKAQLDRLLVAESSNLVFRRLAVWPSDPAKGAAYLVRALEDTSDITIDNFLVKSDRNAASFMTWDAAKWEARKFSGIFLQGPRSAVTRSKLIGVYHGIVVGDRGVISGNIINGFNGDALRAFSDSTVSFNRVFNCVKTDDNHDDGFQSFANATTGVVRNLTINSNSFIEWTGAENHPLRGTLQGIGLYDGFYDNLTITNNLVATRHAHGISVYGARFAQIVNNTVVNGQAQTSIYPWIKVANHRNGTPSNDVLVANNIGMSYQGTPTDAAQHVEFHDNSVIGTPGAMFIDPFNFDYRPKASSGFIDTADPEAAPARDLLNQRRPGGAAPDRGAYETQVNTASASMTELLTPEGDTGGTAEQAGTTVTGTNTTGAKWIKIPGR